MKFTTTRDTLLKALTLTGKALSTNNIMPALSCYRFSIDKASLNIAANNLETFLSTTIAIDSKDTFKVLVPANKISFIKDLPEQPLIITISDTWQIEVKYTGGKISFSGYDGEDFPIIKHETTGETDLNSGDLNEALFKTLYCVASDTLKAAWCGVAMEFMTSGLRVTSLNGYIASTSLIETKSINNTVIVPKRSLEIFQGLPDSELKISFADNSVKITGSDYELTSLIIDDALPPVQAVIPGNVNYFTVDTQLLIGAIKRVAQFTLYREVVFDISDKLTISGENAKMSESGIETLAIANQGKPLKIGFNSDQMMSSLSRITTPEVNIYYREANDAVLLREEVNMLKDNLILVRPITII